MRSIALINQKGGVGKTTATVNLGAALADKGKRVLLIDMDPQANLTSWILGPASEDLEQTVAEVLQGAAGLEELILRTSMEGVDLIPSDLRSSGVERTLSGEIGAETILRSAIEKAQLAPGIGDPSFDLYDYILVDCPPSIGMLTVNALVAVKEVIIPVQAQVLALNGVANLRRILEVIQHRLHPSLKLSGILLCMTDGRTNLSREVEQSARKHFGDLVFKITIRDNVRVAECPSHFVALNRYSPSCPAAADFDKLADEVIKQEEQTEHGTAPMTGKEVPLQETA